MSAPFGSICVIGCGLIGSSVLRAVRAAWPDVRLIAVDADAETRDYITQHHLADGVSATPKPAKLTVLAVPVPAVNEALAKLPPGAVVTDVASVKQGLRVPEGVIFVPGHPIAGSEKTGPRAGRADLFQDKRVILTPEQPDAPCVPEVAAFWRGLGAKVTFMPPELHDRIYAAVSHLPQLLAFRIRELFDVLKVTHENTRFLRLGDSDRALWAGIFAANKTNIDRVLGLYLEALQQIIAELRSHGSVTPPDGGVRTPQQVRGDMECFPYIAASCLISTVAREERALGVNIREFAGAGFADFTSPLAGNPEAVMERASAHATSLAALLEKYAASLAHPL